MTETTDRTETKALNPEVEHALGTLWSAMRHGNPEQHEGVSEEQVYNDVDAEFAAMEEEARARKPARAPRGRRPSRFRQTC